MAKILIGLGILLVIIGVIWLLFPSAFSWIGNLPGDIKHTSGNTRVYFSCGDHDHCQYRRYYFIEYF